MCWIVHLIVCNLFSVITLNVCLKSAQKYRFVENNMAKVATFPENLKHTSYPQQINEVYFGMGGRDYLTPGNL